MTASGQAPAPPYCADDADALAEVIFTGWTGYNYKPWHGPSASRDEDWQSALAAAGAVLRYRPDRPSDLAAEAERLRASVGGYRTRLADAMGRWIVADRERDEARAVLAALRAAFGVLIDMAEMDADGFRTVLTPGDIRAVLDASEGAR